MLPTINEFISKYGLENFVVVADSGLMNNANIAELEAHGYKYIIDAKIKNYCCPIKVNRRKKIRLGYRFHGG